MSYYCSFLKLMKKIFIVFAIILMTSCASKPHIHQYVLENGSSMFFIPASLWQDRDISAELDFNFKNDINIKTVCNITITQKKTTPKSISSLAFVVDSQIYPLYDTQVLFIDSKNNSVRLTSLLEYNDFITIMKSDNTLFKLNVNNSVYTCKPSENYPALRDEFQNNVLSIDQILN